MGAQIESTRSMIRQGVQVRIEVDAAAEPVASGWDRPRTLTSSTARVRSTSLEGGPHLRTLLADIARRWLGDSKT
eukprot:CAMPEP_0113673356 /NCGR_PEP_ID=MMETSP0038_2-20120614/6812_1 /TAXON_ID=2898 /ORGANISM="Cryptomonas paramecium" /LENGTH=74 /DNA_ID=CAMNT_0000589805 /DNA_START=918 /DNA_END=1138 /DNA_ORIENTATION=- /assembly_acc=CAM_ASM_000170